jgi:hypothetical protein
MRREKPVQARTARDRPAACTGLYGLFQASFPLVQARDVMTADRKANQVTANAPVLCWRQNSTGSA